MEPAFIALGVTLLVASLVPLTYGRIGRGAALAYLGAVAWGLGVGASVGILALSGAAMAALFTTIAGGLVYARRLATRRTAQYR